MRKIKTLFEKDPDNLGRVINKLREENKWILEGFFATRKYDGTAVAIINGELYKRFDLKPGRNLPDGAIPCQDPDATTGHYPHWVPCDRSKKADRWAFEAFDALESKESWTYELCGPKINGNREKFDSHVLVPHGRNILHIDDVSFDAIKEYLSDPSHDIEGIVFYDKGFTGKMCKIRKKDFGIKR
jgi:hypothetical protein